jgi:predicted RNA-binding Zn-ribbon protein involved in translation (DUF1610 family)
MSMMEFAKCDVCNDDLIYCSCGIEGQVKKEKKKKSDGSSSTLRKSCKDCGKERPKSEAYVNGLCPKCRDERILQMNSDQSEFY